MLFARWSTVSIFEATFFPVFVDVAVIMTLPGASGFSLPLTMPTVATFLLELDHLTVLPATFKL